MGLIDSDKSIYRLYLDYGTQCGTVTIRYCLLYHNKTIDVKNINI